MNYPKKSLGQNYLIDLNIIKKIINLTNISNRHILEIGPGKGALTEEILKKKPKSLTLIEKDNTLCEKLIFKYKNQENIIIYNKDILKFNFEEKLKKNSIIFGNLPYNISSQILVKIIKFKKYPSSFSSLILMFQKEMAQRIVGKFNTSKYGRLSILTDYRLQVLDKFDVSPNCFFPRPKINSTVLYFKPNNKKNNKIRNLKNLEKITNILFSNKRKMINKTMKKIFNNDQLNLIKNLDLKSRPSELKPEIYYEITRIFENL
tara:strand:- start:776 stop:1561 length:786 start_codon:yes stop_codon:yes gene_type:complete